MNDIGRIVALLGSAAAHGLLLWILLFNPRPKPAEAVEVRALLIVSTPLQSAAPLPTPAFESELAFSAVPPIEVPEPNFSIAEPMSAPPPVITDRSQVDPPRPPPPPVEKAPVSNDYVTRIAARLATIKRYPASARRMRHEGTVELEFTLDKSGRLLSWKIQASSGFPDLDAEAARMLTAAAPFDAFPTSMTQAQNEFSVPVGFSLH